MRWVLLCSVLINLMACTVGPDFVPPMPSDTASTDLPDGQTGSSRRSMETNIRGDWWHLYGSPELDGLIAQALAHNQDIEAANATLTEVREQFHAISGLSYPQASVHGGLTREKVNFISYGFDLPPQTQNLYSIGATISYAVDVFGHESRTAEAAAARTDSERFRTAAVALAVTGNVVMEAFSASALAAQLKVLAELSADDQAMLALVQSARAAGTLTDIDVAAAERQLAADNAQMAPLLVQQARARHTLSVLVGRKPGAGSPPVIDLDALAMPKDRPLGMPSDLVRRRPDILAAEADLHAATAAVGIAQANRFPRLVLTADITQWAKAPNQLWQDMATGAAVTGGITAPLFEGGRLEAQQRAAEGGLNAALARYRQTLLESFAQVATALQGIAADEEGQRQSELASQAAQKALRYATVQRDAGTQGVLPYMAARRQAHLARFITIQAHTQCLKDTAEMFLSLGGGWWETSETH